MHIEGEVLTFEQTSAPSNAYSVCLFICIARREDRGMDHFLEFELAVFFESIPYCCSSLVCTVPTALLTACRTAKCTAFFVAIRTNLLRPAVFSAMVGSTSA